MTNIFTRMDNTMTTLSINSMSLISHDNNTSFIARDFDEMINQGYTGNIGLFRDNKETIFLAREHMKSLAEKQDQIIEASGYQNITELNTFLSSINDYYKTGRQAMLNLGIAVRANNQSDEHYFFIPPLPNDWVNESIYQEQSHQREMAIDKTSPNKNKSVGDNALFILRDFNRAQKALDSFNQFQMLKYLKDSVCAAHWTLGRSQYNHFERVNRRPTGIIEYRS